MSSTDQDALRATSIDVADESEEIQELRKELMEMDLAELKTEVLTSIKEQQPEVELPSGDKEEIMAWVIEWYKAKEKKEADVDNPRIPNADRDALRAMRAASPALQKWWPDGESPRSWKGVTWSYDRVQELDLDNSGLEVLPPQIGQLRALTRLVLNRCPLEVLPPQIGQLQALTSLNLIKCPLKELPPEIGQLLALTTLYLGGCEQPLAPGAGKGQPAQTIVAAYAPLLIVEPRKGTPGQLHAFLLANPLAVPAFLKSIVTDAAHAAWLGEAVKATPSLARLTDADGRRAIDVAHSACKRAMQAALFLLGRYEVDDSKLLHKSATAAVAAATDHGDPEAKPAPRVALKAMGEVEQVLAELEGRVGLDPKYVIAVKAVYADTGAVDVGAWDTVVSAAAGLEGVVLERVPGLSDVIQAHFFKVQEVARLSAEPDPPATLARQPTQGTLDANSKANFSSSIKEQIFKSDSKEAARRRWGLVRQAYVKKAGRALQKVITDSLTPQHCFILVLELADRTLKHTIDHEHIAGKDWPAIRHIASHLGWALEHVHAKGGVHADFKPLNAVGDGSTWKIIDFDVFCTFDQPFGSKVPSSGYCPPEMARVLLRAMDDQGKVDGAKLAEYTASVAYDLWSFGVVLYHLCFGTPLWKTDTDDNVTPEDLRILACAPDAAAPDASVPDERLRRALVKALNKGKISSASDNLKAATALLRKLLEPDEKKRLEYFYDADTPMSGVLEEPFFQLGGSIEAGEVMKKLDVVIAQNNRIEQIVTEIDARTVTIEGLQRATITKMDKHASGLRACIQAAADDMVPTAFVILSHQPGSTPPQGVLDEVAAEVKEAANTAAQLFTKESTGASFLKCGHQMLSLYHRGSNAMGTFQEAISDPKAFAFKKLKEHAVDTLFLSLVCEACWMPQEGAYEITVQDDTCQKVMPIARATLSTVKVLNGIAGLAQCFFPGLPSIPKSVLDEAKATIDELDVESSVAEFDEVQSVLAKQDDDREQSKQDGYCRRQFKQLLEKEDPKNEWAKLKRALLPEGKSIWMCECCAKVLEEPGNKDKPYEELQKLCKPQAVKDFKIDEVAPETIGGGGGGGAGDGGGGDAGAGVASGRALEVRTGEREVEAPNGNAYIQQAGAEVAAPPAATTSTTATDKGGGKGGGDGKGSESNDSTSRPALMTVGEHGCGVICSLQ